MSTRVNFSFDGIDIDCEKGQSLAAALIEAGRRELRRTRFGSEPRSVFCGIGICFDCVVVINGVGNQRACLIEARNGMTVESNQ